jgi:hypothetical protein
MSSIRQAIVAIANGDTAPTIGLQALMGRTDALIVTWQDLVVDGPFPVIAYYLGSFTENGQDNETWDGTLSLAAFAEGNGSLALAEQLIARCKDLFTASAFDAQGLDAAPLILTRDNRDDIGDEFNADGPRDGSRNLRRADLDIELTICQAV